MVFLLLFIILPPVLRKFSPKESIIDKQPQNKIVLLTCRKTSDDGLYDINSKTKFTNGEPSSVTISYKTITEEQSPVENGESAGNQQGEVVTSPEQQTIYADNDIEMFRNLVDADIREDETTFSVLMTKVVIESNPDVKMLNDYFQLLPKQRKYYENMGYTCTKLES